MQRRTYLAGASAVVTGLAGCLRLSNDGSGDEDDETDEPGDTETDDTDTADGTPTEDPGAGPADWREWVPASLVTDEGGELTTLDLQRAREELPERSYQQFNIGELATTFGIDQSDMDRLVVVEFGPDTSDVVLTGSFSPEAILDHLGVGEADTDEYSGYTTIGEQIALDDSAIVVTTRYETFIATNDGTERYLGETDDEWNEAVEEVQDATLAGVSEGMVGDGNDISVTPTKSSLGVDAADGGGAALSMYIYFQDEAQAQEAEGSAREELENPDEGDVELDVNRFDRQGNRIVVEGTAPSFDF